MRLLSKELDAFCYEQQLCYNALCVTGTEGKETREEKRKRRTREFP